ncbi:MAG: hypothetical protein CMI53_03530 [Parcubacteria group bacterium]|nr:hypothetical protein [Parcubacteria group bacterium]|tara:strand:- start:1526 stop:3832 length:2307 start_codon:yes stop_codon:yes gene_type:complete
MDQLEAKINQLVVEQDSGQKTFVRSFVTKPAQNIKGQAGKIFGLIEIESNDAKIPNLIDLIIEEIKNHYYSPVNLKQAQGLSASEQFESALKKTNLTITSFLESEQISLNLNKINIVIALIHNKELHFTVIGDIGIILFYNISRNNYRIINIIESTQSTQTSPDLLKFFSQVISGQVRPRDILMVTTSNLLDYFSVDRIKNIITDQLPADGIVELKELLEEMDIKQNFGVLALGLDKPIIRAKKQPNISEFNYSQAASRDSIKELINTEKETEKLLTPSLLPEIKKYSAKFKMAFKSYLEKTKDSTTTIYRRQTRISRPKIKLKPNIKLNPKINLQPAIRNVKNISQKTQKAAVPVISVIGRLFTNLANQPFWSKLSFIIRQLLDRFLEKFKRLPRSSKILLIVTFVLIILFTQNTIWLGFKNNKERKIEQFNQIMIDAETKKNDAESSLIYRDEGQARQLLIEADELLDSLNPDSDDQKTQIATLQLEIEQQLEVLRHIVHIDDPIQIINFANLDSQANLTNLVLVNRGNLYTQNLNNQSIYKANLESRVMSAIFSPNSNTGSLAIGTVINNNELLFFNDTMAAFILNPTGDTIETTAVNVNDNANIVDVAAFNNRIYLLDSNNNQIYRYSKTTVGYGNIREWISEENLDLSNATSLVIDGAIYILKSTGEILKLENGETVNWQSGLIDPPVESPIKLKTTENSNYLYFIDPPTKRLIIIDKEGKLVSQFTSDSFNDLKDLYIDEGQKEIYLLNGSSIIGVAAQHLE